MCNVYRNTEKEIKYKFVCGISTFPHFISSLLSFAIYLCAFLKITIKRNLWYKGICVLYMFEMLYENTLWL